MQRERHARPALRRLEALNTKRRTVRYTVGLKNNPEDKAAIQALRERLKDLAKAGRQPPSGLRKIAELTCQNTRDGWPEGIRLVVRQVRPSRRHIQKLIAFEQKIGPHALLRKGRTPFAISSRRTAGHHSNAVGLREVSSTPFTRPLDLIGLPWPATRVITRT
ncbi:hypothetical protein ACWD7F_30905 [Streptomyces sp. NPDC005122]